MEGHVTRKTVESVTFFFEEFVQYIYVPAYFVCVSVYFASVYIAMNIVPLCLYTMYVALYCACASVYCARGSAHLCAMHIVCVSVFRAYVSGYFGSLD
jgi:hypothetical protein